MATPFAEGGAVDFDAAQRLARHLIEHGSNGLVVAGTTGESPTLDDSEKLALLAAVIDEVGEEATVICGTGSNDTRHTVELTEAAAEVGADAALVVLAAVGVDAGRAGRRRRRAPGRSWARTGSSPGRLHRALPAWRPPAGGRQTRE